MSELNGEHPSDPVVSTEISPEKPPVLPPEIATTTLPSDARISERKLEANRARAAAYANDPQTELVILGPSENAAVTTCGWARHFFDSASSGF